MISESATLQNVADLSPSDSSTIPRHYTFWLGVT